MATLSELKARRDALQEALDSGVLMVRHGDVSTTFRSVAEMERVLAKLNRQIAKIEGNERGPAVGRQDDRGY